MKLTQKNYFSKKANQEYMSVSQFKAFEKCPAAALAELNGEYEREETTALLVGSYVDSYFEGTLDKFKQEHPEVFNVSVKERSDTIANVQKIAPDLVTKNATWKPGALSTAKALYPALFDITYSLKADYVQAELIIERIKRDKLFMKYMSGQKQVIMTGEICGVPVKIKVDSLLPDKIVDLKIMRDFENVYDDEKGSLPYFEAWGYDLQGAVYQEIVRQNIGKTLPFYLAAATKEKTPDIDLVHMNPKSLEFAFDRFKANVEMYDAVKKGIIEPERCEKCEYCKKTKVLTEPTDSETFYFN